MHAEISRIATLLAEIIATLSSALFAGAAIYINLVEHPARMQCGIHIALAEFAPSYKRATILQASLAVIGFIGGIVAWLAASDTRWLVRGLLLVAVIPFTIVAILPTNKRLLNKATAVDKEVAQRLLVRWGRLHLVRSILSMASLSVFLYLLVKDRG